MAGQADSAALRDVIRDRMARSPQQRITFKTFMELALYHPQHGYYTANAAQLGFQGDFVTSAHLSSDFGELLAEQFVQMWHHLNRPNPFQLVEMGPGQGMLAEAVLTYLQRQHPTCLAALQYTLIETSPALRAAQQSRLQPWQHQTQSGEPLLRWCALQDLASDSVTGCLFANELVDAFPVHQVTLTEAGLQELYVTTAEVPSESSVWQWVAGPLSHPALADYLAQAGVTLAHPPYPIGYTTEVNLAAIDWLAAIARILHQGYVLTIDYGYDAERYYSPARSQGTLQCYYQHAYHNDPLINVGQQDITAHVDFTTLEQQGQRYSLQTLGNTPQALFLMALGLGDRLQALAANSNEGANINALIQRREVLHQLISPMGLGKFTVLAQGKGLADAAQPLKGFTVPPMS